VRAQHVRICRVGYSTKAEFALAVANGKRKIAGMGNILKKPRWLLFADECKAALANRKGSKGGKREECDIHRWYLDACQEHGYEGTEDDWFYLLGWRGRR